MQGNVLSYLILNERTYLSPEPVVERKRKLEGRASDTESGGHASAEEGKTFYYQLVLADLLDGG